MDLDVEMDKCTRRFTSFICSLKLNSRYFKFFISDWFEAGKGPNPAVASLDRDMDEYFKSKKETST